MSEAISKVSLNTENNVIQQRKKRLPEYAGAFINTLVNTVFFPNQNVKVDQTKSVFNQGTQSVSSI